MNIEAGTKKDAWSDLVLFLLVAFGSMIVTQIPVLIYGLVKFGGGQFSMEIMANDPVFYAAATALGTIGTFLLPVYFFKRLRPSLTVAPTQSSSFWLFLLAILFLFSFSPLMSLIGEWNMNMTLPAFFKSIESWMAAEEANRAVLTEKMVMVDSFPRLFINLIVIAALPALGEELFFRGALQNIFTRILKNEQLAVWLLAFIFSAIHFQFYGFIPRMLLGVFFGYMLLWSKNIWIPICAHFINNASVTILAFYYTRQGKSYSDLVASDSYSIIVYLGSLISGVVIVYFYHRYASKGIFYGKKLA